MRRLRRREHEDETPDRVAFVVSHLRARPPHRRRPVLGGPGAARRWGTEDLFGCDRDGVMLHFCAACTAAPASERTRAAAHRAGDARTYAAVAARRAHGPEANP